MSEFGGRTLNSSYGSQFHVNPKDVPEAMDLMHWYEAKGKDAQVESISNKVLFPSIRRLVLCFIFTLSVWFLRDPVALARAATHAKCSRVSRKNVSDTAKRSE